MKTAVAALMGLALLALAAPTAHAQEPTGVTLTLDAAANVPYAGSAAFPVTVHVGCASLLTGALASQSMPAVTVTITDAPVWMTFEPISVPVDPRGCNPSSGQTTAQGSLPFTVTEAAPAVAAQAVTLSATIGSDSATATGVYTVAYNSVYSLTPSVEFPLTVTNRTTGFTVEGVQASNAPSMIMVDDFSCDSGALIAGIGALQYANSAGSPETKTYQVTFTAPSKEWTKATCTLQVYGHYNFDGMAGEPVGRETHTWEFSNGGVAATSEEPKDGKESPAPVFAFVGLGLLAFAALRRKA